MRLLVLLAALCATASGWRVATPARGAPVSSRGVSSLSAARRGDGVQVIPPTPTNPTTKVHISDRLFLPAFLPPYVVRETKRYQVAPSIHIFEQFQSFVNVSVPVRMTVIKLKSGGLFVHAPVAPTGECVKLLNELGPVEYIVLPVTAIEHKVYMRPFTQAFPKAKVYVAPGQFSWPLDLPLDFRVDGVLTEDTRATAPFRDEIDFTGWFFKPFAGSISEVAFFHKPSKTLLVTDAVIYITEEVPEVLASRGVKPGLWKKMALQACFLGAPNIPTFDIIANRLIVSPVIRYLVISRARKEVKEWVGRLCKWQFERVIPAHFAAPLRAGPADFRRAYSFLEEEEEAQAEGGAGKGKGTAAKGAVEAAPLAPLLALLGAGQRGAGAEPSTVVFPESDLAVLKALDKFVSFTGLAQ